MADSSLIFWVQLSKTNLKARQKRGPPVRLDTAYGVFEKTGMACFQLSILGQRGPC